jgi:hypothetical protein
MSPANTSPAAFLLSDFCGSIVCGLLVALALLEVEDEASEVVDISVGVGVLEVDETLVVAALDSGLCFVDSLIRHSASPTHSKPCGQQPVPQLGNGIEISPA